MMSYNKSTEIVCDKCGASEFFALEGSASYARSECRKSGWSRINGDDLCPDCRAGRPTRQQLRADRLASVETATAEAFYQSVEKERLERLARGARAICPKCGLDTRIRTNGLLYRHARMTGLTGGGGRVTNLNLCPMSGRDAYEDEGQP